MADVKSVAIRLTAINADFKKGMAEAGDSTAAFGKVAGVALAAAGAAVSGLVIGAANSTVAYGKEVLKLQRITGDSVEGASKFAFAAKMSGLSADQAANGMKFLQKAMASGAPEFDKIGVSTRDSTGQLRSAHAVFLDTAGALSRMSNASERTAVVLKLFGRSGLDMLPMLMRGKEGLMALEAEAQKYGLVLTGENVAAIKANIAAHRQLDAAMQGAKVQIGQNVLPALTALTQAFAQLPGPVAQAVVPFAGVLGGMAAIATVGPKVVDVTKRLTDGMTAQGAAMSAGAAVGIALVLKGMHDIEEQSKKTQQQFSGGIDWTNYGKAAQGLNAEWAQVNKLANAWNNYNAAEKLAHAGEYKVYNDLAAQAEEDQKHFDENTNRIKAMGRELGITGSQAQAFADKVKVDLVGISPTTYTPIFRELAAGQITAADAAAQLAAAQRAQSGSAEENAAANKAARDAAKEETDAMKAAFDPLFSVMDAQRKVSDAQRGAVSAERAVTRATEDLAEAHRKVTDAERRRDEAARKTTDAVRNLRDAQQALNDALRGPSEDESLNVEAARISLAEAQRRAAGKTDTDPELEKRRNALDVRRAELALKDAEGAHARTVATAQSNVAAAQQALAEAQAAQQEAVRGVDEANKALGDYEEKVTEAQQKAADAQVQIAKANIDLDVAARNLQTAFATGDVSMLSNAETLGRWVAQGRLTQDQADRLTQAFKDMKAAADAADPNAPNNGPKNNYTNTERLGPPSADPWDAAHPGWTTVRTHATGGALDEGWNLVGEQGPEAMFKRGGTVMVRSAQATRAILSAGAPVSSASTAGGFTHNGDIVIGTATERTAADIVWEQRKMALQLAR